MHYVTEEVHCSVTRNRIPHTILHFNKIFYYESNYTKTQWFDKNLGSLPVDFSLLRYDAGSTGKYSTMGWRACCVTFRF
jgi:hypothetical protein